MAYKVSIYDKTGKIASEIVLNEGLFADNKVNNSLIHEYYLLQTSNARIVIAHTKTRGEVSGSGRKIFKQKGTGSARAGDNRSPIRRKGGTVFGPSKYRNFTKDMPKKARKNALYGLLTLKAKKNSILGFTGFNPEIPKTKDALNLLSNIKLLQNKVLVVLDEKNENIEKSFKNLKKVKYINVDYLNPYDLMNYDKILFTEKALEKINK